MANNVAVKCVGVCRNIKVTVCSIKVAVDMYVIPAKGEGYPIILGRPWLMAMNARQDWEKGTLTLKPPGQRSGETIVYNMREGTQQCLEEETSEGSEYSEETTSASESSRQSSSEEDSSIEICGVTLGNTSENGGESSQKQLKDEDLEKMLDKDLSLAKKEGFKPMLRKHRPYSFLTIVRLQSHSRSTSDQPETEPKIGGSEATSTGKDSARSSADGGEKTYQGWFHLSSGGFGVGVAGGGDAKEERQMENLRRLQASQCGDEEGSLSSSIPG